MSIKGILEQPTFLNSNTKLDFSYANPYLCCIPPKNISENFTIIEGLFRFLQKGLISSATFDKKVGFLTANHKRIYKLIIDFIPNDWKHYLFNLLLRRA